MARKPGTPKQIDALRHSEATRRNIPTAEMESFFRREEDTHPLPPKHYPRARPLAEGETRTEEEPSVPEIIWNGARITITEAQQAELAETGTLTLADAQLVWRGKDRQDWSDLVVNVPPLYIQEKIHPKAIIDDLKRRTAEKREAITDAPDLFADFNGIEPDQRAEFYQHDQHWSNRMILGESLQVMASLSERESLKGKVQCIYFDPPYGIKFSSNWQVSTRSREVNDRKQADISREPEQVKAFRDTWKDGIHSYLAYLRDRLTAMRDLLNDSGSIFVQMGEENVHLVRNLLDEIFGADNFRSLITFRTAVSTNTIFGISDYLLWYAKDRRRQKVRALFPAKTEAKLDSTYNYEGADGIRFKATDEIWGTGREAHFGSVRAEGTDLIAPNNKGYKWGKASTENLVRAGRTAIIANRLYGKKFATDFSITTLTNLWEDTATSTFSADKVYVVQTNTKVIERCLQMTTDPGDLVLDPTCGSGTTAFVAEQWGRRWVTMDTSRVALALARTRLMAARYPWYLLADSREGRAKEAALTKTVPPETPVHEDIRQGFVYERVPHITLKSIANNPLIDDIWEKWQAVLEPLRAALNAATGETWEEWQIPRGLPATAPPAASEPHAQWWEARIARQREIDASIAARAEVEYLYDKPYTDPARVRVAGPFTVESLSPHRVLPASEEELIERLTPPTASAPPPTPISPAPTSPGSSSTISRPRASSSRPRATASPSRASRLGPATSSAPPRPSSRARMDPNAAPRS